MQFALQRAELTRVLVSLSVSRPGTASWPDCPAGPQSAVSGTRMVTIICETNHGERAHAWFLRFVKPWPVVSADGVTSSCLSCSPACLGVWGEVEGRPHLLSDLKDLRPLNASQVSFTPQAHH